MDRTLAIAVLALSAVLTGCANQKKQNEAELAEIVTMLPGSYDNVAQVEAERAKGIRPREALAIVIVPIYAPSLGDNVFYVQEMAADDPRRVMSQRIFALEATKKGGVIQSNWNMADPLRWRDAHKNPDVFKMLQPPDLQGLSGCVMTWKKEEDVFKAANDRENCRTTSRLVGGSVLVESRVEMSADELAMSDRMFDSKGKLVYGNADEPLYRFRRRAEN